MSTIAIALSIIAVVIASLTRKEQKKQMSAVERINAITSRLATSIATLKENVATESAQHRTAVEELRRRIANLEISDEERVELDSAIAALETSVSGIEGEVGSVSVIVPDAPADDESTQPPAEEPAPSFTKTVSGTITTGPGFATTVNDTPQPDDETQPV